MNPLHRLRTLLQEATYERDAAFRRQAVEYFNKLWPILDDLYRNGPASPYAQEPWVRMLHKPTRDPHVPYEAYIRIFTSRSPRLNEYDIVIDVEVSGHEPVNLGEFKAASVNGKPTIVLTPRAWKRQHILTIFVHEFIHYLDYRRIKNWSLKGYKKWQEDKSGWINHPYEYNAFYQQVVQALEDDFEEKIGRAKSASDLSNVLYMFGLISFSDFIDFFVRYSGREFARLNPRGTRKLKKRLVELYRNLLKRWDEAFEAVTQKEGEEKAA